MKRLLLTGLLALAACGAQSSPALDWVPADAVRLPEGTALTVYLAGELDGSRVAVPVPVPVGGYHAAGRADAPITVMEFSDFQCPFCARSTAELGELRRELVDGGDVRWVFVDFPLPNNARGVGAAMASRCAANVHGQAAFWHVKTLLFDRQANWGSWPSAEAGLERALQHAGLDLARIMECVRAGGEGARVRAGFELGGSVGVQGTPTFFVNGIIVPGYQSREQFRQVLEQLRAGGPAFLGRMGLPIVEAG
jgi:protein-disulfide isomerase